MATKGDLRDMSLANLVQMLCLDQRKAVLTLRRPKARKGVLFFENGQVIHAEVGPLVGEEAVYHLLGWADGTFEMEDHLTNAHQTVMLPWNYLLLEGMRQVDEQKVNGAEQTHFELLLSPTEVEHDDTLENDLILLLSGLEQLQIRLTDKKCQSQPILALQPLTEIINQVVAFSEGLPLATSLIETLANAADTYPTARLLQVRHNRLSIRIISKLYDNWTGEATERRRMFNEIAQCILAVVEKYFSDFITCFRSSFVSSHWQETFEIFLSELKQEVGKLEF